MKKGYGSEMNYHFLNFIFDNFEIAKLTSKVLGTNLPAIKLHKKFGFIEEGLRRQNIVRGEERINVHLLGLLKSEWQQVKTKVVKTIQRLER